MPGDMIPSRRRFLLGAASVIAAGLSKPDPANGLTLDKIRSAKQFMDENAIPFADIDGLRQAIAACVERCLNPPWIIPEGAAFSLEPHGFIDSRCKKIDNAADWERLDALYKHYMAMMGGKDAPMTATELHALNALACRGADLPHK